MPRWRRLSARLLKKDNVVSKLAGTRGRAIFDGDLIWAALRDGEDDVEHHGSVAHRFEPKEPAIAHGDDGRARRRKRPWRKITATSKKI
jgi:hypothetical protein